MKDVVELLLDLVRIPSVSSITNQPVIDYATAALDPPAMIPRWEAKARRADKC